MATALKLPPLPTIGDLIRLFGLKANQKLSQNFLLDLNVTIKAAGDLKDSIVIEVGPGPGSLTRSILSAGAKTVIAVEKDRRFFQALESLRQASNNRLHTVLDDMTTVNEQALLSPFSPEKDKVKIIANLPFSVGTHLMLKWLRMIPNKQGPFAYGKVKMVLMFQDEVADRIVANVNTEEYGRLSVMTQRVCIARKSFVVPGKSFVPPPKVNSGVVYLESLPEVIAPHVKTEALEYVLRKAFGMRRKSLQNALKISMQGEVDTNKMLEIAKVDGSWRPDQLDIQQWCNLAHAFQILHPNPISQSDNAVDVVGVSKSKKMEKKSILSRNISTKKPYEDEEEDENELLLRKLKKEESYLFSKIQNKPK